MSDELPVEKLLDVNGIAEWFSARGFPMKRSGVYRLVGDGWPVVKVRGKLIGRPSALERHLTVLEVRAENRNVAVGGRRVKSRAFGRRRAQPRCAAPGDLDC